MKYSIYPILILILYSCTNHRANVDTKDSSVQPISDTNENKYTVANRNDSKAIPDFLAIANTVKNASRVYLQGVEKSDSSGPYVIKEFVGDTLSFDLIFYPKNGNKSDVTFEGIKGARMNDYHDFYCFVFVYPMKDPDKMKDYHADNAVYPVVVNSYVRKENSWTFLSQAKARNLSELSEYEIKTLYSSLR